MSLHLVLLPGLDGTGNLFTPLEEALDGRVKVYRLAYPTDKPMDYAQLELWVRERLPAEPFVLLGESFSGPLAISIAARPPAHMQGIVLCCTFARAPRPWCAPLHTLASPALHRRFAYRIAMTPIRWMLLGSYATGSLNALVSDAILKVHPAVLARRLRDVLHVDVMDLLRSIRLPALALTASDDHLVPHACQQAMQHALPTLHTVAVNGPHCLLQAAPAACAKTLLEWCQRFEGHNT